MEFASTSIDLEYPSSWIFTLQTLMEAQQKLQDNFKLMLAIFISFLSLALLTWASSAGGPAWTNRRNQTGRAKIPGVRGLPFFGSIFSLSHGLAHRTLACMATSRAATKLMAFSLGSTPVVVTSDPQIAREILNSPHFANRPIKQSAKSLMFSRAIGFAPNGPYWRLLRKIASTHLFAPKRIVAHETGRQFDCFNMLKAIKQEQALNGLVVLRNHLQATSLNNIMGTVFGKRFDVANPNEEAIEMQELVREGFELLGAFNFSDYLPWLSYVYDPFMINKRCRVLASRVRKIVKKIIEEHRLRNPKRKMSDNSDFVDVLLSLDGEEKLEENDMVAVLWEMIFRGTDTIALLTEWTMAELVLNPAVQVKLHQELQLHLGNTDYLTDADVAKLPYLHAIVKETLRVHPPGPLLSWARMSTSDVHLSNGMIIPSHTTAMVNVWAITHDPKIWEEPSKFKPERFMKSDGGADVDVRGGDLRLSPFGAGRRVCPGRNLGLVTVSLYVAKLVQHFEWLHDHVANPVDLSEVLKLSCEMKNPLAAVAISRKTNVATNK